MASTHALITQAYDAFNRRDIDAALTLMTEDVSWPKASEGGRVVGKGGRVVGKEAIRAYWTRQWQEFDPHVEPIEVIDREGGNAEVRVHQLVKSLGGEVLSDSEVGHVYIWPLPLSKSSLLPYYRPPLRHLSWSAWHLLQVPAEGESDANRGRGCIYRRERVYQRC